MRTIAATRYVTPLKEGGSLPAIVEAEDSGLYVLKFRGAGQGVRALIAELVCGELARALGLTVPEVVLMELDPALGRNEPDSEIRELLKASAGLNLALDYLPRSITFDPVVGPAPSADEASRIVWFDALITNVDRTPKNPNLLCWHKSLYLIDHGAALYFQHGNDPAEKAARSPFPPIKSHVLLPWATRLREADAALKAKATPDVVNRIVEQIPEGWLSAGDQDAAVRRELYREFLQQRLADTTPFLEEAERARTQLL